jgi:hypothetical protein
MTGDEAYAAYEKWWKEKTPEEPEYTYSGWLHANNIEITDDEW